MASPQAEPRPPFTYSLPAYAARRPTVLSPALRTNLVPNLMNRNTGRIASSRLTSMPPETPSVNLECSPPPPDLNLPDACSPLCYTDPGLHPELLTCSLPSFLFSGKPKRFCFHNSRPPFSSYNLKTPKRERARADSLDSPSSPSLHSVYFCLCRSDFKPWY